MEVVVGSTNTAKVEAVEEILQEYPHLAAATVRGVKTDSGVSSQPKSLDETVQGAMNRARAARGDATYGIGIESGLMQVPNTKSGYMDVCACAIFDGEEFYLGLSSAWEFPDPKIMHHILNDGMDMSQAINHVGLTKNPEVGSAEGAIGILTKGRLNRKDFSKQAIRTALIHLEEL